MSKRDYLEVIFSVKTHKVDLQLRVIVSENGTWIKPIALFLQKKLSMLPVDDPYMGKNSEQVINFFTSHLNEGINAFSIDIKDMNYSIPHTDLLTCVESAIDDYGVIAFQNTTGVACSNFLELLGF